MNHILEQLKEKISNKISNLNFNTWILPIVDAHVKDNVFTMLVPNKFIADWINDYYGSLIVQELFEITKESFKTGFEILPEDNTNIDFDPQPAAQIQKVKTLEFLNSKYSFDRFVVGSSNQFAHAACKAVAELPGGRYNPLFLYGGVGLGKTHLLHAIGLEVQRDKPHTHIIYVSAEKFMNDLINSLRYQKMPEFRKKYRDRCDVLLIDDVQFLGGKERTQEEFFHTFNTLHDSGRQIVVTSDKIPKEIQGIEERLRSRLEWGLIADIGPPDLETRIAILRKKSEAQNIACPDDVAMFLASSIKSNVRELEGSLIRISAFASLTGGAITIELAREVLGSSIIQRDHCCTIEVVQKIVADYYKITIPDLKSPKRTRNLAFPRQVAMFLCKKHVHSSFPEIGNKFGGKDHTTVMHACKKIQALIESDSRIKNDILIIERSLQ